MLIGYELKELGEILTGNTPSTKNSSFYDTKDIMFAKPGDMDLNITDINETQDYISNSAIDKARIVPKDSLLVVCIGATVGKIGVNKDRAAFNQQINAVIHNKKVYSSKYLAYVMLQNRERLIDLANSAVVPIINKTRFSEFKVNIHATKEEQKEIVELLDKSQSLIDKRKAQLEGLDELVKSRFIEMFGYPVKNPMGWEVKLLGEVCEMKAGKNIKASDIHNENLGNFYPCYGGNGLRGYVEQYSHEGNIPLIGRQGALCGNVKYAQGKFYATEHAVATQSKVEMNSYWLYFLLSQLDLNKLSTGAAQPGLTIGSLNLVEIPISPIFMQNKFEKLAKQVDKLKFEMQKSLTQLENNFNVIMQRAFKGELFD
ncbi:restriction endonuclease subunit S [Clostridium tagluense]|uniref:Type I restriction-modification protein subunit S n=1 Tax=Clostridium tagluense TaxID=360422 RepID=A0A401UT90_9CLOT|nr:restriction endonuclease subunit S [Clostridium tagluense]GCD12770.1 type I restriction-modification protein subunit S [Clostridium tagluense]